MHDSYFFLNPLISSEWQSILQEWIQELLNRVSIRLHSWTSVTVYSNKVPNHFQSQFCLHCFYKVVKCLILFGRRTTSHCAHAALGAFQFGAIIQVLGWPCRVGIQAAVNRSDQASLCRVSFNIHEFPSTLSDPCHVHYQAIGKFYLSHKPTIFLLSALSELKGVILDFSPTQDTQQLVMEHGISNSQGLNTVSQHYRKCTRNALCPLIFLRGWLLNSETEEHCACM
jgi:hypothetical protein